MEARADKIKVGLIGASGYTGLEFIKLIHNHPVFELSYAATSEGGTTIAALHPSLSGIIDLAVEKASVEKADRFDLIFLALPHKTAFSFAKQLSTKVVDLSADYRLELDTYEKYYCKHEDKAGAKEYTYGLIEHYRKQLQQTKKVAVPGCYPTAALLGLLPLKDHIKSRHIVIDAKSGISGAGKKCSEKTMFCKDNENAYAYAPLQHRHMPEIAEKLGFAIERINFVPQLIPVTRGMMVNIYAECEDIDAKALLQAFYKDDSFVRIKDEPVELKNVAGTHYCDIFVKQNGSMVFINAAIDNLLRGASSQAIAAANIICGLDENVGLPRLAYVP